MSEDDIKLEDAERDRRWAEEQNARMRAALHARLDKFLDEALQKSPSWEDGDDAEIRISCAVGSGALCASVEVRHREGVI